MTATDPHAPQFWKTPFRFLRYTFHVKPHYAVALSLGILAPVVGYIATPLRRKYLYEDAEPIPQSYPIPKGPRQQLTGFDDE